MNIPMTRTVTGMMAGAQIRHLASGTWNPMTLTVTMTMTGAQSSPAAAYRLKHRKGVHLTLDLLIHLTSHLPYVRITLVRWIVHLISESSLPYTLCTYMCILSQVYIFILHFSFRQSEENDKDISPTSCINHC